jgi:hypothetical protein
MREEEWKNDTVFRIVIIVLLIVVVVGGAKLWWNLFRRGNEKKLPLHVNKSFSNIINSQYLEEKEISHASYAGN